MPRVLFVQILFNLGSYFFYFVSFWLYFFFVCMFYLLVTLCSPSGRPRKRTRDAQTIYMAHLVTAYPPWDVSEDEH